MPISSAVLDKRIEKLRKRLEGYEEVKKELAKLERMREMMAEIERELPELTRKRGGKSPTPKRAGKKR